MSEIDAVIAKIEREIETAQVAVSQRDDIVKLCDNPLFRKLIIEGYMRDECARYTHTSTDPNISVQDRADALLMAQSAGCLKRWLNVLILMGNNAEKDILQKKEAIDEIRTEAYSSDSAE